MSTEATPNLDSSRTPNAQTADTTRDDDRPRQPGRVTRQATVIVQPDPNTLKRL